jgi:hypothetical protein
MSGEGSKVTNPIYPDTNRICYLPVQPEGGGALNSLRNFRLQKKKFQPSSFTDSESSQEPASQGAVGRILASDALDDSQPSVHPALLPSNGQPASQQTEVSSLDMSASSPNN